MPQFTLSVAPQRVLGRNPRRKSLVFTNTDRTRIIWAEPQEPSGVTILNASLRMAPGASVALNITDDGEEQVTSPWTLISEAGTPRAAVFDSFDKSMQPEESE